MHTAEHAAEQEKEQIWRRTEWFRQDRFGMFIHWGLYAIPARGEWVQSAERISAEAYREYFDAFNPEHFEPADWARAAKQAGMKYAVLTAKHHDGFCLFDSKLTDYTSVHSPCGRDMVREFVEAFRAEGLRIGLYYSLLDWHHPDYPAYGDAHHPQRDDPAYSRDPQAFDRYVEYMHGQIRELLTNYGTIDIMWFDFSYGEMTADKWKAAELMRMVRELAPDLIVDNRLDASGEHGGSIMTGYPLSYSGDFASPEQIIPPEGVIDALGFPIPWEACITLNNNWGYHAGDQEYKSATLVIRKLVECVSKGGNLLLNVGPNARGEIPEASLRILDEIGEWMRLNGDSIYGCGRAGLAKPEWGRYTAGNGNVLYAHLMEQAIGPVNLCGLAGKVRRPVLLRDGAEVKLVDSWNTKSYPEDAFINFGAVDWFTYPLADPRDTVIKLEIVD